VRVMIPLMTTLLELRQAKMLLADVMEDLEEQKIPFNRDLHIGMMVEVPAAVMMIDHFVQEVDFLSIGTNDLIQYTLAIDRQNRDVAYLYKPLHLSVLRSLRAIADAGRSAGIPVSMCGEVAGDPRYALLLLALGLEELSMPAGQIPVMKALIRRCSRADAVRVIDEAMKLTTAEEIDRHLRGFEARLGIELA